MKFSGNLCYFALRLCRRCKGNDTNHFISSLSLLKKPETLFLLWKILAALLNKQDCKKNVQTIFSENHTEKRQPSLKYYLNLTLTFTFFFSLSFLSPFHLALPFTKIHLHPFLFFLLGTPNQTPIKPRSKYFKGEVYPWAYFFLSEKKNCASDNLFSFFEIGWESDSNCERKYCSLLLVKKIASKLHNSLII